MKKSRWVIFIPSEGLRIHAPSPALRMGRNHWIMWSTTDRVDRGIHGVMDTNKNELEIKRIDRKTYIDDNEIISRITNRRCLEYSSNYSLHLKYSLTGQSKRNEETAARISSQSVKCVNKTKWEGDHYVEGTRSLYHFVSSLLWVMNGVRELRKGGKTILENDENYPSRGRFYEFNENYELKMKWEKRK